MSYTPLGLRLWQNIVSADTVESPKITSLLRRSKVGRDIKAKERFRFIAGGSGSVTAKRFFTKARYMRHSMLHRRLVPINTSLLYLTFEKHRAKTGWAIIVGTGCLALCSLR